MVWTHHVILTKAGIQTKRSELTSLNSYFRMNDKGLGKLVDGLMGF